MSAARHRLLPLPIERMPELLAALQERYPEMAVEPRENETLVTLRPRATGMMWSLPVRLTFASDDGGTAVTARSDSPAFRPVASEILLTRLEEEVERWNASSH